MPRIPGTTDSQSKFLRHFLTHPTGPSPDQWPSPVIFRRWLKKPTFRQALNQLRDANRHHAELQLSFAAAHAASTLQQCFADPSSIENQKSKACPELSRRIENAIGLLRLHHIRQRFPIPEPQDSNASQEDSTSEYWTEAEQRDICQALNRARAAGDAPDNTV